MNSAGCGRMSLCLNCWVIYGASDAPATSRHARQRLRRRPDGFSCTHSRLQDLHSTKPPQSVVLDASGRTTLGETKLSTPGDQTPGDPATRLSAKTPLSLSRQATRSCDAPSLGRREPGQPPKSPEASDRRTAPGSEIYRDGGRNQRCVASHVTACRKRITLICHGQMALLL